VFALQLEFDAHSRWDRQAVRHTPRQQDLTSGGLSLKARSRVHDIADGREIEKRSLGMRVELQLKGMAETQTAYRVSMGR